jgi:hypothetical protein
MNVSTLAIDLAKNVLGVIRRLVDTG